MVSLANDPRAQGGNDGLNAFVWHKYRFVSAHGWISRPHKTPCIKTVDEKPLLPRARSEKVEQALRHTAGRNSSWAKCIHGIEYGVPVSQAFRNADGHPLAMPHISAHTAQAGALPKQWLHWAKLHGLRPESRLRKFRQIGLVGLGFRFRVNCHDKFQISCPLAEFDRWANSTAGEVEIPRTQDEFTKALARLIDGVKVKIHSRDLYFQQHTARPGMRDRSRNGSRQSV